jgi:hypothetical protein
MIKYKMFKSKLSHQINEHPIRSGFIGLLIIGVIVLIIFGIISALNPPQKLTPEQAQQANTIVENRNEIVKEIAKIPDEKKREEYLKLITELSKSKEKFEMGGDQVGYFCDSPDPLLCPPRTDTLPLIIYDAKVGYGFKPNYNYVETDNKNNIQWYCDNLIETLTLMTNRLNPPEGYEWSGYATPVSIGITNASAIATCKTGKVNPKTNQYRRKPAPKPKISYLYDSVKGSGILPTFDYLPPDYKKQDVRWYCDGKADQDEKLLKKQNPPTNYEWLSFAKPADFKLTVVNAAKTCKSGTKNPQTNRYREIINTTPPTETNPPTDTTPPFITPAPAPVRGVDDYYIPRKQHESLEELWKYLQGNDVWQTRNPDINGTENYYNIFG